MLCLAKDLELARELVFALNLVLKVTVALRNLEILNPHLFFEKETTSVFRREEVWLRRDA